MAVERRKITEGYGVSGRDEADAVRLPGLVNILQCTFPLHSGSLGAYYIELYYNSFQLCS
jgi:hypothetical protein